MITHGIICTFTAIMLSGSPPVRMVNPPSPRRTAPSRQVTVSTAVEQPAARARGNTADTAVAHPARQGTADTAVAPSAREGTVGAAVTPSADRRALRRTPVVDVFERTRDAVVNIQATQQVERVIPFGDFFGGDNTERYTATALGSGFVIHPDGYVVTNAHVVSHANVKVIFADKSEYDAEKIAIDERHDLAVLKIRAQRTFPALVLGRSDDLMIGETVIAIGNPLGYEHTVTTGIVSATNRKLNTGEDVSYDHLIQTDASINRGNSGGPLLNILGELIGINTAIRGDAQNIGFAIPVDTLRQLLPEMLSAERSRRFQVGLRLQWRDRTYVTESTGPAAAAGIQAGDELVGVNGKPVRQDVDYYIQRLEVRPTDPISLELSRNGRRYSARVQPEIIPSPDGAKLLRQKFGMAVRVLTAQESQDARLRGGLVITSVEPGGPADRAGMRRGHIIAQIGKYVPSDLDDAGKLLENVASGDKVLFRVYENHPRFIRVLEGYLVSR
jgi:serine protease Do